MDPGTPTPEPSARFWRFGVPVPRIVRENRGFRWLWIAQTISVFGDHITLIALPLVAVLVLGAGAEQMGYLGAAVLAPNLLFSLPTGAWVDRIGHRRRFMIVADIGRAALIATIPIAYALDALTLTQLYIVAFLTGTMSVLFFVSYGTLFVSLIGQERYVEAQAALNGSRALAYVAGPSIGGALIQFLKAPLALIADAASFIVSALLLRGIDAPEPPTEEPGRGHVVAGVRFIAGNAIMRASLLATATINLFNFVFFALFVLYATRALRVSPGMLGLVLGAGAVGGLIGSALTPRIGRRIGIGRTFLLGCVLFPAPLMLVPLAGGPRLVVLAMLFVAEFFSGFGVMMLDIGAGSIFAAVIPDRLRARVAGAYLTVNYGVRPLGSLIGGALGATIGLRPTLWIATAGAVAGFLWLLPSPVPGLRTLPERAEETPPLTGP